MGYNPILKPIVRSPLMPELIEELLAIWKDEQKRREAFYDWVTPDIKAEFIDGQIVVHSPVRNKHNITLQRIFSILNFHNLKHDLGYIGYEKIMCRFHRNDYEPDLVFFKNEKADSFTDDQTIFPIPDLIVEVLSESTEDRDRGVKFIDYAHNGVQEYWIVDADIHQIEQYINVEGEFVSKNVFTNKGIIKSNTIAGFEIDVKVFFDKKKHLKTLQELSEL